MALRPKPNVKQQERENEKIIEINAKMQGSMVFTDPVNLKINGEFNGTLETRGTLTIGNTASVEANINGDSIIVAGKVKGDIVAKKMLVLMPTAVLRGNISSPKLNIVEGALFQGNCQMPEENNLLDIDEVSKYLEIDIHEIEKMANSGEIPGKKENNTWKFERAQIDHWASSQAN
ncbi:MAG TPA: polymer-forming cytoskeletal protein [Candidatus Omnitrophota bacterium]|nr:polymer-forming cytoskeletal protein [Candidatus Omnitrophota bacterium]HPN88176.1 polymer-forming cytoskeletal protein [Candidatus Omnitrophota bacterium]